MKGGKDFIKLYRQYRPSLEALADWQSSAMAELSGASGTSVYRRADPIIAALEEVYQRRLSSHTYSPESIWKAISLEIESLMSDYARTLGVSP
jgi:hypothetical protein